MKRKSGDTARLGSVYAHEANVLESAGKIKKNTELTPGQLRQEYYALVDEYGKLLRQTLKITRVGDSNQKKLLAAYDKIEVQNTQLDLARKEADRANSAKSEFLAKMSHEIRTPMNAILGMTELTMLTQLNDEQSDYLHTVKAAGQNLLEIINNILDLSKIEAGQMTLEEVDFNLEYVIGSVVNMLSLAAFEKGLDLSFTIAPDVPVILEGDPARLRQVVTNLAANAVKFTRTGQVEIRVETAGDFHPEQPDTIPLCFTVRDTGIGIPRDKLGHIFQSFSQADSSTTRKYGGTGLGLAICKQLVELMEGTIRVESKEKEGSRFIFTARFRAGDPGAPGLHQEKLELGSVKGKPLRILLAEDNPMNAKLAVIFLTRQAHRVVHAVNGKEALARLRQEPFDLVLMDIEMPEMDGFETARSIRGDRSGAFDPQIPILAMTAHLLPQYKEKIFQCGMNDFITKPVDLYKFSRVLDRIKGDAVDSKGEIRAEAEKAQPQTLDREAALKRLEGDADLYRRFCTMFADEIEDIAGKLQAALARGDFELLRRHAHYLKGSAAMIGADAVSHRASQMEQCAVESRDPGEAQRIMVLLLRELEQAGKLL